ncbi:MAG: ECF transporter S component [Clostridia bacterium]|nr:ECF transporter S component [Clostridia bacterium]
MSNTKKQTERLALGALFTALVIILQLIGSAIRLGPFSISLVLVPIVLGAALCGYKIGGFLGLVFGAAVLISGDAGAFLAVDVFGTVLTVLAKGLCCGLAAGLVYKALSRNNTYLAVIAAAIVCPIVNTGVFLLGCLVFFMEALTQWGTALGFPNVGNYIIYGVVGGNFLVEMGINIILAPVIIRVINIVKKNKV